jgi:DNA polymerase III delta prime subunit
MTLVSNENNLANKYRPSSFDDYVSQNGPVRYLKSVIESNAHPSGIIINGSSGTGKTSLAQLYVRSTLCLNRQSNQSLGCGTCEVCTGKDSNNVYEYRITEATSFKNTVGDLIDLTKSAPIIARKDIREDNNRRFIILDEVQNASRQSISPFLDSLEFSHPNVTIILISMDLSKMDEIVRDAIESRCVELTLHDLSEDEIINRLTDKYEYLDNYSARLIAYLSRGNLRKAWSTLEYFLAQVTIEEITPTLIYEQKFGGMSVEVFSNLIDSLESKTWNDTLSIIKSISSAELMAVDLLLRYLVEHELSPKGIQLVSSLSTWYQCTYKAPLACILMPYQGEMILSSITNSRKTPSYLPTDSSSQDLDKMKDTLLDKVQSVSNKEVIINNEIENEVENEIEAESEDKYEDINESKDENVDRGIPFCLTVTSWKELMNIYAEYN